MSSSHSLMAAYRHIFEGIVEVGAGSSLNPVALCSASVGGVEARGATVTRLLSSCSTVGSVVIIMSGIALTLVLIHQLAT